MAKEITNIKSGAVSTVTEEQWAIIEKAGWKGKYRVKTAPMGAKRPPFVPLEVKEMKKSKEELPKQETNKQEESK